MKISLVANNSGTSKIHFVVVFMDMAGDLGVMVEHSNSPFVFCYPGFQWSFSLTVVYKTVVGATDFVHYARLWPVNLFLCRGNKLFTVLNGLKATLICCFLKIRPILSEMLCT